MKEIVAVIFGLGLLGNALLFVPQVLAGAKQHRRQRKMQFVDQSGLQIFANGGDAAAKTDVASIRRSSRPLECGMDAVRNEMERRAAFHFQRRARVMRQHEHRHVIRGFVAPPAFPAFIRPGTADRAEHIAAENPRPDSDESFRRHLVVDIRIAAFEPVHALPRSCVEEPVEQRGPADAERILQILMRAGAVAVDRDREGVDTQLGHGNVLASVGEILAFVVIGDKTRPQLGGPRKARAVLRGSPS